VDTASARVLCQGQAKADGSDYRVVDAAGNAVPFQLMFHDAARYSLLSFRVANPRQRFFIYFGNSKAERSAEQVVIDPTPGAGQPRGAWVPRYGLVLQTIQRPKGKNPEKPADMAQLIATSQAKYGARYQRRISDGYNSFGPSDYYISIYRGWMQIPKTGKYQFCTVSNESSFSFLDGKDLVHWPGRHTVERGVHGEKNASVELTAGLHYIEYYHEEVTLDQMAFLGWRPSEDKGAFGPIPESIYTAPHDGVVAAYESARGALVRFEPSITDSIWPTERHQGQYTRCRFQVAAAAQGPGTAWRWDFGDGQTAQSPAVEHVYLALGTYMVRLTAQGPGGSSAAAWPLEIYEIENVTDQFKEGVPRDYARVVQSYDRGKLDADNLRELAYLYAENEQPARALEAATEYVSRVSAAPPAVVARVRRLMAECSLRLGKGGIDQAIANYQAALGKDTPLEEKLDVLARLMRLLGIERNQPEKAGAILSQVEEAVRGGRMSDEALAAYRRAVIAAGDVLLWHGKLDGARDLYLQAETRLSAQAIPAQVRSARVGAYPDSIRQLIKGANYGAALDIVNRWEESFPTDKLKGQTLFWRGKLLALRQQPGEAARYLARAVSLGIGADFESQARWLLAQTLEELNRVDDARRELAKLVATGIQDDYARMARARLMQIARKAPGTK
jgi:PKD repeat protein